MSKILAASTMFSFVKTDLNKRKRYARFWLDFRHFILGYDRTINLKLQPFHIPFAKSAKITTKLEQNIQIKGYLWKFLCSI
jgi:hypothetical protein